MLTEDYIHTDSILASAKATAPLATFLNGQGQSEALVLFDDGELCHLQREPLSSSGWNFNGIGYKIGSITAANRGSVWMMDEDHAIWMTNAGHWNELGGQPVGDVSISAGLMQLLHIFEGNTQPNLLAGTRGFRGTGPPTRYRCCHRRPL
jgi:hypothetical protein